MPIVASIIASIKVAILPRIFRMVMVISLHCARMSWVFRLLVILGTEEMVLFLHYKPRVRGLVNEGMVATRMYDSYG